MLRCVTPAVRLIKTIIINEINNDNLLDPTEKWQFPHVRSVFHFFCFISCVSVSFIVVTRRIHWMSLSLWARVLFEMFAYALSTVPTTHFIYDYDSFDGRRDWQLAMDDGTRASHFITMHRQLLVYFLHSAQLSRPPPFCLFGAHFLNVSSATMARWWWRWWPRKTVNTLSHSLNLLWLADVQRWTNWVNEWMSDCHLFIHYSFY